MDANKAAAETANQIIARQWYAGIDLTYLGISLPDCMAYDVLNVLGRAWIADENRKIAEQQQAQTPPPP